MRLVGAFLLEQNDEWALAKIHVAGNACRAWRQSFCQSLPAVAADSFQLAGDDDPPSGTHELPPGTGRDYRDRWCRHRNAR